MLSPVALAAGDFLTWRIRLPDSGSSSPPCEKGEKRMEQYTTQKIRIRYVKNADRKS